MAAAPPPREKLAGTIPFAALKSYIINVILATEL
jgi:hypothetical protein